MTWMSGATRELMRICDGSRKPAISFSTSSHKGTGTISDSLGRA